MRHYNFVYVSKYTNIKIHKYVSVCIYLILSKFLVPYNLNF